jgi:hypothetical protein
MDPVEYAVLAWVESGHAMFQPTEPTEAERQAFQRTAARLLDLRERGLVEVAPRTSARPDPGTISRSAPVPSPMQVGRPW